jgi:hypothetical protein
LRWIIDEGISPGMMVVCAKGGREGGIDGMERGYSGELTEQRI